MPDGYWFAWHPIPTYVLCGKRLLPSGWVWMRHVFYIDTILSGRVYIRINGEKDKNND